MSPYQNQESMFGQWIQKFKGTVDLETDLETDDLIEKTLGHFHSVIIKILKGFMFAGPKRGRPTWGFPDFVRTSVRPYVRPYVSLHIRFQFYPIRPIYFGPPIFLQIPDLLCIDY